MTPEGRHPTIFRVAVGTLAVLFFLVFVALGTWQVKRRAWKLDLIARVEQRVHASPVSVPEPGRWSQVTAAGDEYRHVSASGQFLNDSQTLVQAVTERGSGYWVLTPLRTGDGRIVFVNRGFVAADVSDRVSPAVAGRVTGLLRMSEPGGAFLRHNRPAENRWYSRDVQAIAQVRGLPGAAPFFIDADAAIGSSPEDPVGGLTVIRFHNSHLVYAITWYTLALMTAGALWIGTRNETHP